MRSCRRVAAVLEDVTAVDADRRCGVLLTFRPERSRSIAEPIRDLADLGPELTVEAVAGLGRVIRMLRAARVASPGPGELLGAPREAALLLRRALGTEVVLSVRPRSQVRFVAWTESGVETVADVTDVQIAEDAFVVRRGTGRPPVRFPREAVVRQRTELDTWYEIVTIERPEGRG